MKKSKLTHYKVLQFIQENWPVTQSEIAKNVDISLMNVNKIVNYFLSKGILDISGKKSGISGRKSFLFKIKNDLFYSVGIKICENNISFSIIRSDASIINTREYELDNIVENIASGEKLINIIKKYYDRYLSDISFNNKNKIAIIGIVLEGIIDTENGRCILGTHIGGVIDFNLRDRLNNILNLPIMVDDPARSMAYYEKKHGVAKNMKNFIYLYLGKGIGSGIVINGKLYRGFRGIAGEVGHIIVNENGTRCKCGNYGCLETVASEESIIRQMKEGIHDGVFTRIMDISNNEIKNLNLNILKKAIENGDKFALNIIEHVGYYLGKAVALLVNIFNPELIVLGGRVSTLGEPLLEIVNRIVNTEALNVIEERTKIVLSDYDEIKDTISVALEAYDKTFIKILSDKGYL